MDTKSNTKNKALRVTAAIIFGLTVVIACIFLFTNIFSGSPTQTPDQGKNKKEQQIVKKKAPPLPSWRKEVERRLKKNDTDHKIIDSRLDRHADAIDYLENEINKVKEEKKEISKEVKPNSGIQKKFTKGWDFKDFPENW